VGSILNILFEFQIEVPLVEKWMECKFQKVGTFTDVAGQSSKNWNLHCPCFKEPKPPDPLTILRLIGSIVRFLSAMNELLFITKCLDISVNCTQLVSSHNCLGSLQGQFEAWMVDFSWFARCSIQSSALTIEIGHGALRSISFCWASTS